MTFDASPIPPAPPMPDAIGRLNSYYAEPMVRRRILEFLGGDAAGVTTQYITADDTEEAHRQPLAPQELAGCLDRGLDICRSLWDRESLLAHLDVEYVNYDHPAEAYQNPARVFALQEPVVQVIHALLDECGIAPLHVLSGRGHHFVWRIRQDSAVFRQLAKIGREPPSLRAINSRPHPPNAEIISPDLGAAFAGLGLVMEYLAHRVKELAAPRCAIPVELTAVEVGPSQHGREMISVDISEYGDPLHTRALRVPFSIYHKPAQQRWLIGDRIVGELPPLVFVPLAGMSVCEGIGVMRDLEMAADLAARVPTEIPAQQEGTGELLARYLDSSLARFHHWFYAQEQHPPEAWPDTYDRTPMEPLPTCARMILAQPNDLLLRPSGMRMVTLVMLALGWHPRHIAGLIHSKFARDFQWGDQWSECDPASRAELYTRIFSGLFAVGRDDLVDFNCQSTKEEGMCPAADCPHNLELFRQSALARRHHDQLAHRPFNRLFLPAEPA